LSTTSKKSRIVCVNKASKTPIELENGDFLYRDDLVRKLETDDEGVGQATKYTVTQVLKEFEFQDGRIIAAQGAQQEIGRKTRKRLDKITDECGIALNSRSYKRLRNKK